MKALKIIVSIILVLILAAAIAWFGFLKPPPPPISADDRAQIKMMPLPASLTLKHGEFLLDDNLGYTFKHITSSRLDRALQRFYSKLGKHTGLIFTKKGQQKLILDCQTSGNEFPAINDDESYKLVINDQKIVLTASSETGILYGLESLLQLVKEKEGQWIFPALELNDKPRYPWRGLMIDVARHWIPKEVILRNLDAMAAVKMNVFHWHLTDYQGFRVESKTYPKLHEMGSDGKFYTQNEIKEIINYAADRGIRVIPEFDLPGHTTSWFVGYPELATVPGPYVLDTLIGVLEPVMDPTKDQVYNFIDHFIGEIAALFPDEYIHIGGDEVNPKQWEESTGIQNYMAEKGFADVHELQAHFNIRLQKILEKHDKKMMGWDEIIHPDLPKEGIVVQSWRSHKSLWDAAGNGNKAVLSAGYYLDYKRSAAYHYKVDPEIISEAITIDIDSTNWRSWECVMTMKEMKYYSTLYLFGEGDDLRGILSSAEQTTGFEDVTAEDQSVQFEIESSVGKIKFDLNQEGDSLKGEANLSLFSLDFKGKRIGGSDMTAGKPLPKFEKIEPLSPEQAQNILGGEACMWSEMVDSRTIESRIWPRAAAIAEKMWSPAALTQDVDDMYRRLIIIDYDLATLGLQHRSSQEVLIREMLEAPWRKPMNTLVSVLQEDKLFNRMKIYGPEFYTTIPLNRIVDMARPESYISYQFNKDVDLWMETHDKDAESRIIQSLRIWSKNYDKLVPAFKNNERLKEVEPHSIHLSKLSQLGLMAIEDPELLKNRQVEIDSLFMNSAQNYGGTILSVEPGIRKLISD